MQIQAACLRKLPAANLTLVPGVGTLAFAAALSVRRVVVSADRRLIAEHQVTDLTLDTL